MAALAGVAVLAVAAASCSVPFVPPPAGTELDCWADGRGGAVDCVVDLDRDRPRSSTLRSTRMPVPRTSAAATRAPAPKATTRSWSAR